MTILGLALTAVSVIVSTIAAASSVLTLRDHRRSAIAVSVTLDEEVIAEVDTTSTVEWFLEKHTILIQNLSSWTARDVFCHVTWPGGPCGEPERIEHSDDVPINMKPGESVKVFWQGYSVVGLGRPEAVVSFKDPDGRLWQVGSDSKPRRLREPKARGGRELREQHRMLVRARLRQLTLGNVKAAALRRAGA